MKHTLFDYAICAAVVVIQLFILLGLCGLFGCGPNRPIFVGDCREAAMVIDEAQGIVGSYFNNFDFTWHTTITCQTQSETDRICTAGAYTLPEGEHIAGCVTSSHHMLISNDAPNMLAVLVHEYCHIGAYRVLDDKTFDFNHTLVSDCYHKGEILNAD